MNENMGHAMTYLLEQGWSLLLAVRPDRDKIEIHENHDLKTWSYLGPMRGMEESLADFATKISRSQRGAA